MARQRRPREQAGGSGDVAAALAALDADELRAFIGETLERLDHLGQHEMVEEVLSVDLHDCVGRCLLAVYVETSPRGRAILEAIDAVQGISAPIEPVRAMEQALGRELPDAGAFLDEWIARLEASAPTDGDWESDQERWLIDALDRPPCSLLEPTLEPGDPSTRLSTPTTLAVLDRAEVRSRLTPKDRAAALDAMRVAASKRTEGVTGEKRRRHYEHAAMLVGCCVEADRQGSAAWCDALRARTSRFPAYQEALRNALGGAARFVGTRSFADGE